MRRRLGLAVVVVAVAVGGAAAPGLLGSVERLRDAQSLVSLAERTQHALTLAHALADERDEVTAYIAAGRPHDKEVGRQRGARVDRDVAELRTDAPPALRGDLDKVAAVRRSALTGKESALDAHEAYSAVILRLHALAEELAADMPTGTDDGAQSLADLDTAVEQAAATRGLLLAALAVPKGAGTTVYDPATGAPRTSYDESSEDREQRDALTAAAQLARLREKAAHAQFEDGAPASYTAAYDSTVSGPDANAAEKALDGLTDSATLSSDEKGTDPKKLDAKLTARVELMRGAESSLSDRRTRELAALRDDDVTALEVRAGLAAACLLLAVAAALGAVRGLTRPLAVLRRGTARLAAAEPGTGEPIRFTGRDDEFADVVRSVNALHERAAALRAAPAAAPRAPAAPEGAAAAAAEERAALRAALDETTARLGRLTDSVEGTFVGLALRTLGLVERQLGVIEGLEESEEDPDRLATLFRLDHLATVMRRHSENLLVLAGAEHGHQHHGQVPLVDVVRAAVSEIERYERVTIASLPPHADVAGFAADDLSHLLAELLENATVFSPPEGAVELSGWLLESGEVMLSVTDEGIGMDAGRLDAANARLADPDPAAPARPTGDGDGLGLGFYVVARLAGRHGVRVRLREQKQGGIAAVAVLPPALVTHGSVDPLDRPAGPDAPRRPDQHQRQGFQDRPGLQAQQQPGLTPRARSDRERARPAAPAPAPHPAVGPGQHPPLAQDQAQDPAADTPTADPLIAAAERTLEFAAPEPAAPPTATPHPAPPVPRVTAPPDQGHPPEAHPEHAPAPRAPQRPAPVRVTRPGQGVVGQGPINPYAIGPDAHERTSDRAPGAGGAPPPDGTGRHRLTEKGLPKRRPRITPPAPAPAPRARGVDAEALRSRLGGFQRGALEGRRDAEAEIASGRPPGATGGAVRAAEPGPRPAADLNRSEGDSAEEASS
ncbi:nitrate- and nitrite sensing domain-containing protein [Streptomyces sp. NPDC050560]|uniref:sensor histidine kinase n=1 Tax=Streptomyces sp. NPDC050560 TaxID=3365630 RepID=UPI0037983073